MRFSRAIFILSLFCLLLTSCTTRYYLVRHAEKTPGTGDVPLSEAGMERARALADSLVGKSVDQIFVTQYLRTQQTAQPLANTLSLVPEIVNTSNQSDFIARLKGIKTNRTIVIVGHSNTVPQIIDGLMGSPQGISIGENDYDNLYLVRVSRATTVARRLIQGKYGAPTP